VLQESKRIKLDGITNETSPISIMLNGYNEVWHYIFSFVDFQQQFASLLLVCSKFASIVTCVDEFRCLSLCALLTDRNDIINELPSVQFMKTKTAKHMLKKRDIGKLHIDSLVGNYGRSYGAQYVEILKHVKWVVPTTKSNCAEVDILSSDLRQLAEQLNYLLSKSKEADMELTETLLEKYQKYAKTAIIDGDTICRKCYDIIRKQKMQNRTFYLVAVYQLLL
jgi:hypothetical protein